MPGLPEVTIYSDLWVSANLRLYRLCTIRGGQANFLPFHVRLAMAEYHARLAATATKYQGG
jgi:hypothetical protein